MIFPQHFFFHGGFPLSCLIAGGKYGGNINCMSTNSGSQHYGCNPTLSLNGVISQLIRVIIATVVFINNSNGTPKYRWTGELGGIPNCGFQCANIFERCIHVYDKFDSDEDEKLMIRNHPVSAQLWPLKLKLLECKFAWEIVMGSWIRWKHKFGESSENFPSSFLLFPWADRL